MTLGTARLLLAGGAVAGFVNSGAGGRSAVTIPILGEIVDASFTHGSNRIAGWIRWVLIVAAGAAALRMLPI